jgi:hypothetical protein
MSQDLSAGKEILSYCGKCKLKLAHVIMSMKDSVTPHKVQCKTCNSTHQHKLQAAASSGAKSQTRSKVPVQTRSAHDLWNEAMRVHGHKNKKSYSIKAKFQVGDVISHPSFGEGFVQANLSNDRIEVLFQSDIKNLVHGKN